MPIYEYTCNKCGEEFEKLIKPELLEETNKGGIGVGIVETGIVRYPVHLAVWNGIKTTFKLTWYIMVAFYDLFKDLILGRGLSVDLGGPVRIAEITGEAARMGFSYLINFAALLSINLAIINALPIPALDGGRVLFLAAEKLMGRPMRKELEAAIHNIAFILLIALVLLVTYKDILRLIRG